MIIIVEVMIMHNRSIICAVDRKYTVKDIHRCIHAVMALTAVVLLLLVFAASSLLQVKADEEKYQYNNVDTGYEAVIEDDADIIDESNYSSLLDIMKQITVYGNVMLKTIDTNSTTTESYVRSLYREKYGTDSGTIFIIDMYNRNIWIHSNGKIYSTVTSSYADTITDNVYRYASSKDYYMCAYKVYEQELALLKGRRISQPMKYISNVLLAVVAALIINYGIVRLYLRKKAPSRKDIMKGIFAGKAINNCQVTYRYQTRTYSPVQTDSGSSSSGGSSGGSSSGGSSGGGGGGGGGHSF